jgi:hypothetical protein
MKLFPIYTGKEKLEIEASSSFSCGPTFRQKILKIILTLLEKLVHELF